MPFSNFVMVKRERNNRPQFYVVYSQNPRFTIEVDSDYDPFGRPGRGFIKSIRINNSWTGDYHRCLSLANKAETFFRRSFLEEGLRG